MVTSLRLPICAGRNRPGVLLAMEATITNELVRVVRIEPFRFASLPNEMKRLRREAGLRSAAAALIVGA